MKKPRKLTPPPKDTRKELYFEIESVCTRDWHDGEQWGSWERTYDSSLEKISRNKDLLNKWNFEAYQVNDEVYNAQNLYTVVVTYSSGDTFGRADGHVAIAFVTENPDEAIEARKALDSGKWDDEWRDHPKNVNGGYAPWNGYFESVTSVDVVFLPVMG